MHTPNMLRAMAALELGIKPEMEVFDSAISGSPSKCATRV